MTASPGEGLPRALVLRGGTLLTLDAGATVLPGADLLIEAGRIASLGVASAPPEAESLDVGGCLVLPGLVQAHLHLGQTVFRGLAEGRTLLPWLRERIWPLEAAHDEESAYWSALLGAAECLLSGTTTVQDIGLGPGARGVLRAIVDSGLRGLGGRCLMDEGQGLPATLRGRTDEELAGTEALGNEFDGAGGGRLRYLLNPRFLLSCSEALWEGVADLSRRRGWPVHTHALEQREETEAVRALKGGRDEIDCFEDLGLLDGDLRVAHGVCLTAGHLGRLSPSRFRVAHCPSANLKLGSGILDLPSLRDRGFAVGIGADGAACNNGLDPLWEARLAALLQHMARGPAACTGLQALRLATSEGARAVGLEEEVGSLEPGKRGDVLVLGMERPELLAHPSCDPHDLVVFSASRASIRHVLIDGRLVVRDGRLTHLDLDAVRDGAKRCLGDLVARSRLV